MAATRKARGGVLVAGGGFAGGYVARLLGRARRDDRQPGELHALHAAPARGCVRDARAAARRRAATADVPARRAPARPRRPRSTRSAASSRSRRPDAGSFELAYEHLVLALGSVARTLPVPGLAEHAVGFKDLADAIHLRNRVLGQLEAAGGPARRRGGREPPGVRLRRRGLRGSRGARRALRSGRRRAPLLPAARATSDSAGCSSTRRRRSCPRSRRGSATMRRAS